MRYSGLILPPTITFFHFSYFARVKAAACSGLVPRCAIPIFAKAAFSSGCCSTLLTSPLSFASTAGGSPVYADVPTVAESGLPGFDVDLWIGIYAPAGLPPAVLAKLNGEINKVLQHPELKSACAKIGIAPRGTSPEQAAAFTRAEYEKWKKVIVEGKIKPE